jgi:glutathione synthase/RimK-type ligase-like ATP-grasp enzyme
MVRCKGMADCTLVTCALVPDLDPDDRLLQREMQRRGLDVSVEVWSEPQTDWSASTLCVLRSTWDYHVRYDEFVSWIDRASAVTRLQNGPHLLKWNADKSYLRALQERGVPIVPTAWVARGERCSLATLAEMRGWRDLVLKPAKGLAGHGVSLVRRGAKSFAAAQARLDHLAQTCDMLIQPYLEGVFAYGERALIFIDGHYSHAIVKKPFDTLLAISDTDSSLVEATGDEIAIALKALDAVPAPTLYARVDLLRDDDDNVCVSELELIEPALYFGVHELARAALADAVIRQLAAFTEALS